MKVTGPAVLARRTLRVVCAPHRRLAVQRPVPAVPARGLRPRGRRALSQVVALRLGGAAPRSRPTDAGWCLGPAHDDQTGLLVRDLETSEERWLAHPVQHDDQESRATLDVLPGMSFTPDSRYLVVSYGGRMWKLPVEGGGAEEIPFRVQMDLTLGPRGRFRLPHRGHAHLHRAPDSRRGAGRPTGRMLAFTALDRLWGLRCRRLQPEAAHERPTAPSTFRPGRRDGEWIAYATWGRGGRTHVQVPGGRWGTARAPDPGRGPRTSRPRGDRGIASWRSGASSAPMRGQGEGGTPGNEIVQVSAEPDGDDGSPLTVIAPQRRAAATCTSWRATTASTCSARPTCWCRFAGTAATRRSTCGFGGATLTGATQGLAPHDCPGWRRAGDQALVELQRQIYSVTVPRIGITPHHQRLQPPTTRPSPRAS